MKPGRVVCVVALCLAAVKAAAAMRLILLQEWAAWRAYAAQGPAMHPVGTVTPFGDFSLFWLGGRLARDGAIGSLYDFARYHAVAARIISGETVALPFIYPPLSLPVMAVMSWPSLAAGYYLFVGASLLAAVLMLRRAGMAWWCVALAVISPVSAWAAFLGQFSLFCGAALLAGLMLLPGRPVLAGAVLGTLAIKPQYALLVPVVLCATRDWRAVLGCVGMMGFLAGLATAWFGGAVWAGFLGPGQAEIRALMNLPFDASFAKLAGPAVSPFWLLRSFGAGLHAAYAVQCGVSLLAAVLVFFMWRRREDDQCVRLVLTICLAILASPYSYINDLTGYAMALPLLAKRDTPWINAALAGLWIAPVYASRFLAVFGLTPVPFLLAGAMALAWICGRQPRDGRVLDPMAARMSVKPV